ncbi:MAG: VCBS repeat-containing protein [Verrucomicrobiota bacterium]|jgi:hypothetical protein
MANYEGENPRSFLPVFLAVLGLYGSPVEAKPAFGTSDIPGSGRQLLTADLDGDGLKDLVLMEDTNLAIFFQDPKRGFRREPQIVVHLEPRPSLVWTAQLGGLAASLLVMTSDGVSEISLTNRTGPPSIRDMIRQPTILPAAVGGGGGGTNVIFLPMSAETTSGWPLLLLPSPEGIQVWRHGDGWHCAQTMGQTVAGGLALSAADSGYTQSLGFDLSVGDVNGDGRDDLMIRQDHGWTNEYRLYLQETNGLFSSEPAMVHVDKAEPFSWLYWGDFNRDGKVDLLKSVWLNEPSFMPGVPSGKVVAGLYFADEHGRISPEPRQTFRKNDWTAALPVVDVDGDGYPDLVLGYRHMDDKESFTRMITDKEMDYTLRFYFNRSGNGFAGEAAFQRDAAIHLEREELMLGWNLPGDLGPYIQVGGDFAGDGKANLLVRERSDEILVYYFLSREKGFSPEPDLRFHCPWPVADWQMTDLNNDGVSDLIVRLAHQKGYRIFISQR